MRRIETRLERLEQVLGLPPLPGAAAITESVTEVPAPPALLAPVRTDTGLESEIGEFWLARVGVVALMVGLGFIVLYPFAGFPVLLPSMIGYAAAGALFALARFWRGSMPDTARIVFGGAFFLLHFATLRLHFFAPQPAVESRGLVLALIALVLAVQYAVAVRRGSEALAALATALVVLTGIVSDTTHVSLALPTAAAAAAVWLYGRHGWWRLLLTAILLVNAAHLHWLLGSPLAGHPLRGMTEPHLNLWFLLVHGTLFIGAGLLRPPEEEPAPLRVVRAFLAGGGLLLLGLLNARMFHASAPPWIPAGLAVLFLAAASAYWLHHRGRYAPAVHACFGYLALSAAIILWRDSPGVYSWLAWQGLLVVATAVWFRSKIIVVANLFIFGGIYLAYFMLTPASGGVNLSFALVALLIARVLNWQRDRLDLRTEFMRSVYLGAATVIIPYGLYHTVPKSLVSTSWLGAAAVFFVVSVVLDSHKYRWMAMLTIFATIGYVFVVDLSRLEPAYRILSFLVLGVVLLAFSIYYARRRRQQAGGGTAGGQ